MCLCVGVEGYCMLYIISLVHNVYVSMFVRVWEWEWEEGGGGVHFLFVCSLCKHMFPSDGTCVCVCV